MLTNRLSRGPRPSVCSISYSLNTASGKKRATVHDVDFGKMLQVLGGVVPGDAHGGFVYVTMHGKQQWNIQLETQLFARLSELSADIEIDCSA